MLIIPGFADFAGIAGVVEITRLNTSEFYYLDELYGNVLLLYLLVSTRAVIGQFSGPYSPVRPAKI